MTSIRTLAYHGMKLADCVAARMPACGSFRPLRGSFSGMERLRDGQLQGRILHERQTPGRRPPDSITERSRLGQDDHQPWPVFWTLSENARLTGRIRLWRDGDDRYCAEGNYHFPGRRRLSEDKLLAHMLPQPSRRLEGAWTSIASNWGDGRNYFHWLTDNLTRLLVRESLPEPTRILLPVSTAPYIRETLEILGLAELCESPPETDLRVERFYFCSPLAMSGVWNPLGFDWLRRSFAHCFAAARSGPPVFLTRRGSNRIPAALAEIEARFLEAGFEIVDCGKLNVREQIATISAAPAVAGIHGAAMTNLLWAPRDTPVLEVFEPGYLNACYEQIAFQGGLRYSAHVIGDGQPMSALSAWCDSLLIR